MASRVITNVAERDGLLKFIMSRPLPITVEVVKGKRRSVEQNRLQRSMLNEIAEQIGQTAEEVRAYCKLTIGVPILRAENEIFAERYDRIVKPLPYEQKIALMSEPFDMPVTRIMTTKQKTQYIDAIARFYAGQGVVFKSLGDA